MAMITHGLSGGVGKVILNYVKYLPKKYYEIDILTMHIESEELFNLFTDNNLRVIKIPSKKESLFGNMGTMYSVFKKKGYDIVHSHLTLTNCFPLFIAMIAGIKVRISHSHLAGRSSLKSKILSRLTVLFSTERVSCGNKAGKFLYGDKSFYVLKNAVDFDLFKFNNSVRFVERNALKITSEDIVFGSVARFSKQKNHKFIIEIFAKIHEKNKNTKLLLIGNGELIQNIKKQVASLNLSDCVLFLGAINDVNRKLLAIDVLLVPSLFEGLSLSVIEAQAVGIKCLLSDTIDKECAITDNVFFLNLGDSVEIWSKKAMDIARKSAGFYKKSLRKAGYDLKVESQKLDILYKSLLEL